MRIITSVSTLAVVALFAAALAGSPSTLTYKDVKPIFDAKCKLCHNGPKGKGRLDASSYAGLIKGGEHGKAILPKNSAASPLMKYIKGTKKPRMPFKQPPLTAAQMQAISKWIQAGAKK
jgi:hypothetical protein